MEKKYWILIAIIGFLLLLYGLVSAIFFSNSTWYSFFVIGGTLFLGFLNYKLENESILKTFEKSKLKVFKIYFLYLLFTILIEIVGRFILHLWEYPTFNLIDKIIHVFLIGYPFAFFFIYESFILIRKRIQRFGLTVVLATLVNAFVHEIPNTFAWGWRYTIPYIKFEILQINIVIIFGWIFLIAVPLVVNKILKSGLKSGLKNFLSFIKSPD